MPKNDFFYKIIWWFAKKVVSLHAEKSE